MAGGVYRKMTCVPLVFLFAYLAHADLTYPFGTTLGENRHVTAFSNGGNLTMTSESNYVGDLYSGVKWQCVEYARRWLITVKNVTFASVDKAADIWGLESWTSVDGVRPVPTTLHANGVATEFPPAGSLIIWPTGLEIGQYGHVAVITGIGADVVYITEENYDDTVQWISTRDYSRSLSVLKLPSGHFQIQSPEPIYGWISMRTPACDLPADEVPKDSGKRNVAFFVCLGILVISILGFAVYAKTNIGKRSVFMNLPELVEGPEEAELDGKSF